MAYRERRVAISCGPVIGRYELVSRHLCHCGAHTRTKPSYTAGSPSRREHCVNLLDHPLAIGGVLLRSGTSTAQAKMANTPNDRICGFHNILVRLSMGRARLLIRG